MSLEAFLSDNAAPAPVAIAVLAHDSDAVAGALDALDRQVYGATATYVVGGGTPERTLSADRGATWVPSLRELIPAIGDDVTYVWLVDGRARPRPDALRSLVVESFRVDAAIAGSKVLDAERPSVLRWVGTATDVFEVPYSGLDGDEVDQHQYEVVRDVATVPAASLLVRRDLLRGLRGIDRHLASQAAAIDLCQRARLRGARVVVVPSSEVLHPSPTATTVPWDEEAGRIRAALKVYSVVTLLWVLPGTFATALAEAIVAPFLGRWTLFNLIRAWLWNLLFLPSTLSARFQARRGRVVGDEELFRYQVRGSARLRSVGGEIADRLRERFPQGEVVGLSGLVEAGQATFRSPAFVAGLIAVVFALVATRSIWGGTLPAVGYTLPPSEAAVDTLRAYAGGWNVAGLGSPEPLPPAVAVVALAQLLLFDRPELTAAVLTVAAFVAGAIGTARLMRGWGLGGPAGYVAGIVLMGGPATQALAGRSAWIAVLALGVLPWVLRVALRTWPKSLRGRVGRIAALGWLTGVLAAGMPALLVVPTAVLVVWALLGQGGRWMAPARAAAGGLLAVPMLFPWFGVVALEDYLEAGALAFWTPWWPAVALVGVAAFGVVVGGDRVIAAVAGWGAVLAAGGLLLGRSAELGAGRDVMLTGMVLAALGSAAVAGAAAEALSRLELLSRPRRPWAAVGIAAGLVLAASVVLMAGPGRAGLPGDVFGESLRFTAARGDATVSRALVAGPADMLPGEARTLDGAAYRVVSAPMPRLWETYLGEPRLGDIELEDTLRAIASGEVARAGEALAPFGIQWVVMLGPSPFADLFEGQLDLVPLTGLSQPVFLSEADAVRAVADDGTVWQWDPPDYRGPSQPGARILLAENGDQRWSPGPWQQAGWANRVGAQEGVISFAAQSDLRREALGAGVLLLTLLGGAIWGTGRKAL